MKMCGKGRKEQYLTLFKTFHIIEYSSSMLTTIYLDRQEVF